MNKTNKQINWIFVAAVQQAAVRDELECGGPPPGGAQRAAERGVGEHVTASTSGQLARRRGLGWHRQLVRKHLADRRHERLPAAVSWLYCPALHFVATRLQQADTSSAVKLFTEYWQVCGSSTSIANCFDCYFCVPLLLFPWCFHAYY